jgi:hypothetical protein
MICDRPVSYWFGRDGRLTVEAQGVGGIQEVAFSASELRDDSIGQRHLRAHLAVE